MWDVTTTRISGYDDETAVFAESSRGDLSLLFRFDTDVSNKLSNSSRVVACFHKIEVDDEEKTFLDRKSMRQAIHASVSHVWPICASHQLHPPARCYCISPASSSR